MILQSSLVLLDTSILVHLIRDSTVGRKVNETLHLTSRPDRPLISVVTVGEVQALALKLGWADKKVKVLDALVRQLVIVHLHQGDIISRYATIDCFCEKELKPARRMSQNDMWIAATAAATSSTLVTSDLDFNQLAGKHIQLVSIDARTGEIV